MPAPAMIGQNRQGMSGTGSPNTPNVTTATSTASGKP